MLQADAPREVWLRPSGLTPTALRSLAAFLYTDRLDAPVEDAEVLVRAVRAASRPLRHLTLEEWPTRTCLLADKLSCGPESGRHCHISY